MVQKAENPANRARAGLLALFACLLAGLALAAWPGSAGSAPARVIVLGQTAETPPPSCPGKIVNGVEVIPCRVEGHVTGYQAMAGGVAAPYEAPFDGKVVAWSITLARPSKVESKTTSNEISFFNDFLGRPSQARIGVLRPIEDSKPPKFTLVRQSPLQILNPYFGSKVIFALEHPLTVLRGQVDRPDDPDLGADVRLQRLRRKHLARQPPARPMLEPRRHPGRPPPAGRRQDQDLRLLLLERPPALHGDPGQRH